MTIRKLVSQSGFARAYVRYYEQKGLLASERTSNGCRIYSAEDLATLRRIRLLRGLFVSLEDIQALQAGSVELSDILERKIQELVHTKEDASYAQSVCRAMREDGATYATLDAQKYLESIPQQAIGTDYFSRVKEAVPGVYHPWRRYFARTLDMILYSVVWMAVLVLIFQVNIQRRGALLDLMDSFVALLMMLFVEPLLLQLFGTTLGKWIFGLRLEDENGGRPRYVAGLSRVWGVLGAGMGFNIPIYGLIRHWKSYDLCSQQEPQPWDGELVYTMRDTAWYRGAIFVGANVVPFGVLMLIQLWVPLPPNRGDLGIAQFAENYNTLASYYGDDDRRLSAEGRWTDGRLDEPYTIPIDDMPLPEFRYTVVDGHITGIGFEIDLQNADGMLGSRDDQMMLAALAFIGAGNDMDSFSDTRENIIQTIADHSFEDFFLLEAGVSMTCDVEYSGYAPIVVDDWSMLASTDGEKTRFHMSFAMEREAK